MINNLKKITTIFIITILLFSQVTVTVAIEAPTPPPQPTITVDKPEAPSAPTSPSVPSLDSQSAPDTSPTVTPSNDQPTLIQPTVTPTQIQTEPSPTPVITSENTSEAPTPISEVTGEQSQDGQVGDPKIQTGDALNSAAVTTEANTNLSPSATDSETGNTTVSNTNNGSSSDNSASTDTSSSITTTQDNKADAVNNLSMDTTTGENSASKNVGNSTIQTGDADTSGTVVTELNTNLANVGVSEFNIVDDQSGDLILDFAANCISGCGIFGNTEVSNTDNGSDSTNSATLTQNADSKTFQNNDATLENNVTLTSNSGDNTADKNTGGDSSISTGNANTSANILNFLNNNIAGNVVLGIVNVFGDLIGDIILPDYSTNSNITASNIHNGTGSTNISTTDQDLNNQTFQTNDAIIENNLNFTATTGDNETNKNTNGDSAVQTGDANIESQTLNIANSNINGGDWWLVLVNEAGQWVGKILGASDGTNYAGSAGTQFSVNPNGDITATNSGNGSNSDNTSTINQSSNNTTVQNNIAKIINNINLFANTGGNSASKNTGGNSTIQTGDASIVANLVNFVNNNIVGGGKLTVVTINVFGKWFGDFVGPGQKKEAGDTTSTDNNKEKGSTQLNNPSMQQANNNVLNNSTGDSNTKSTTNNSTGSNNSLIEPIEKIILTFDFSPNVSFDKENPSEIAGESSENSQLSTDETSVTLTKSDNNKANTISLNLAWLIFIMPLLLALYAVIRWLVLHNKQYK